MDHMPDTIAVRAGINQCLMCFTVDSHTGQVQTHRHECMLARTAHDLVTESEAQAASWLQPPARRVTAPHLYSVTNCSRFTSCSGASAARNCCFCCSSVCCVAAECPHFLLLYSKKLASSTCVRRPAAGGDHRVSSDVHGATLVVGCSFHASSVVNTNGTRDDSYAGGCTARQREATQMQIMCVSRTIRIRVEMVEDKPSLVARAVNWSSVLQD
jgi:hypothetical protein